MTSHFSLHVVATILLALVLPGSAVRGESTPVPVDDEIGGTHAVGDARVRYFVFKFTGTLERETVAKLAGEVVRRMEAEGKSGRNREFYKTDPRGVSEGNRIWLKEGDVLVLGWVDKDGKKWGWVAADTRGIWVQARHRWISNSGKAGTLTSKNEAHGVARSEKEVKLTYRAGSSEASRVFLQLYADESRLTWWMGAVPAVE